MTRETDDFVEQAWANLPKVCPVCGSKRLHVSHIDLGLNGAFHGPYIPGIIECLDCTEEARAVTTPQTQKTKG